MTYRPNSFMNTDYGAWSEPPEPARLDPEVEPLLGAPQYLTDGEQLRYPESGAPCLLVVR
ncbi:hypothetical protein [Kitasatospora sp. GP82]|uniref:hypothetical protein n=1 Tax=Kitasatospora sp. GP82 TaxID=3035089 RepID=UPI002476B48F|nr:hypothetical protein [Kitasatospora sp. GP82]MDH6130423.1 hypothetical protein [Kitasatospora sp. GP82]